MKKMILLFMVVLAAGCSSSDKSVEETVEIEETTEQQAEEDSNMIIVHEQAEKTVSNTTGNDRRYCNELYSYCFTYNSTLFVMQKDDSYDGRKFISADKKAKMIVYGYYSVGSTLDAVLADQLKTPGLTNVQHKKVNNTFTIRGRKGNKTYFEKTILHHDRFITFSAEFDVSANDVYSAEIEKSAASITVGEGV